MLKTTFTAQCFDNEAKIKQFYPLVKDYYDTPQESYPSVEKILQTPSAKADFWVDLISRLNSKIRASYFSREEHTEESYHQAWKKIYSSGFIYKVSTWRSNSDFNFCSQTIQSIYPYTDLIESVRIMSRGHNIETSMTQAGADTIARIENLLKPFEDERFRAEPMHTRCNPRGYCHSLWLKKEKGHYHRSINDELDTVEISQCKSPCGNIFMDAPVGILFFFKDRPCFYTSFSISHDRKLFIHQIQSVIKGRGHYHLSNWRQDVIEYLKEIFFDFEVYIITPENAVSLCVSSYCDDAPDYFKPNQETLSRIRESYAALRTEKSSEYKHRHAYFKKVA